MVFFIISLFGVEFSYEYYDKNYVILKKNDLFIILN